MRYMCINKIKSGWRIIMYINNDRCNVVTISMSDNEMKKLEKKVRCLFELAKKNMKQHYIPLQESCDAISDVVPGYSAKTLYFGSYDKSEFIVLFIDMRNSTSRAMEIGPERTFLTMYAYLPTVIGIIDYYKGAVIDIMGDGVMAFWDMKKDKYAINNIELCAKSLLNGIEYITNSILKEENIPTINCGIGIECGEVIVTKIGWKKSKNYDVKAFGNCINCASKLAGNNNVNDLKFGDNIKVKLEEINLW